MVCLLDSTSGANPIITADPLMTTTTTTCSNEVEISCNNDTGYVCNPFSSTEIQSCLKYNSQSSIELKSSCNLNEYTDNSLSNTVKDNNNTPLLSSNIGSLLKYISQPSYISDDIGSSYDISRTDFHSINGEKRLVNGTTYSKLVIPLETLQGSWISSVGNEVLKVDLLWIYIRNIKCKKSLRLHHGNWRWMGWDLKRISLIDGKKILFWKHDREEREIVWRQHENVPKLECLKLDVKGTDPTAQKAHALLNRAFVLSEPVRDHEGAEMYALQYEGSIEGPFAAAIIVRDCVNLLIYFATRAPLQGLGYGKVLLERVMSTTREDAHDPDANRWIAVIRKKTKLKKCDSTGWWNAQSFVKDVSEELDDVNPFNDCILLEYTKENTAKRRRISKNKKSASTSTTCSTTEGSRSDRSDCSV